MFYYLVYENLKIKNRGVVMGKTSSQVKQKYDEKTYRQVKIKVRYDDDEINNRLDEAKQNEGISKYILDLIRKDIEESK